MPASLSRFIVILWFLGGGTIPVFAETKVIEPWRAKLSRDWHQLAVPPITPYSGPFGGETRAFIGPVTGEAAKTYGDYQRLGLYDPARDSRKINLAFEDAALEDWRRMGYNTAYKGGAFGYRSGRLAQTARHAGSDRPNGLGHAERAPVVLRRQAGAPSERSLRQLLCAGQFQRRREPRLPITPRTTASQTCSRWATSTSPRAGMSLASARAK